MKNVRWGILGTAGIARSQTIPAMQQAENCDLCAIAVRDPEKARSFQEEFGFEKVYTDYDVLLADPDVEAVYIPLPNDLHYEWVLRALNAGKHVLCEKPLALSEAQEDEMFRTAEANNVYLMEAFAYLHSPLIAAVKRELEAGTIGEVRYLASAFLGGLPRKGDYRWRKSAGGGAAYDLCCYPIGLALWLLGREPDRVRAMAQFSDQGVDLFTSVMFQYKDGLVASLDGGMLENAPRMDRFHILGTWGEIYSPVQFNQCGEIPYTVVRDGKEETKNVLVPNNYRLELEQLSRCVRREEKPMVTRSFSMSVARTLDKVLREIGY